MHILAPGRIAKEPEGHWLHALELANSVKVLIAHKEQTLAAAAEYIPGAQFAHTDDVLPDAIELAVPAGHDAHADPPTAA